ncbi:c-type cytochrome [Komagataeibacter swingsii]|uniref:Alcohol dehydrogenase n=1 Tax=Komagataeibacter swingsii TaxID=215220 RepID=A0A2V4R1Y0_9PROT|nr:c-type cytochrome [Komagataeibacter swingsii]PYD70886.1 alcohol dehydrogenase [Komagataeibacter swingsii]GBQ60697.1 aldehyde dehydrogenase cytochrome c subunit [Komagataeibacter swingsii DSM 16373]
MTMTGRGLGRITGMLFTLLASTGIHPAHAAGAPDGQYLTRAADCEVCHTRPGGTPFAGGRAFAIPGMGVIYSPNITADRQAGIGAWTDDQFVKAVRDGVSPGWKHLYPAMPYRDYAYMTPDEVKAIRAYLATLPTSAARPPENTLKFPFSIRSAMIFWNLVNGPASSHPDDPAHTPSWNRGRYLVEGPGHCAECHSPRTITMGVSTANAYAGADVGGWRAYNITSSKTDGIGAWSADDLATYLSTGHADGHGSASGDMGDVVSHSLRYLTRQDIDAMVEYLRDIPARSSADGAPPVIAQPTATHDPADSHGAMLYAGACAGCHLPDGSGRQNPVASIAGARTTLGGTNGQNLLQVLTHGSALQTATGTATMPAFHGGYSDQDVADIANFVMHHFGQSSTKVTAVDVAKAKATSAPE